MKLLHKIKLLYLKPWWVLKRAWKFSGLIAKNDFVKLEEEIKNFDLDAKRREDKEDIAKSEGRIEVFNWFKENLK